LVDEEAVSLIRRWIADDLGAPQRKAQLTEEGR
jgi:hypothetical protein